MKITPENRGDLIQLVTANFRSFGGGCIIMILYHMLTGWIQWNKDNLK